MADEQIDPEIIRKLNEGLALTDDEMQKLANNANAANKAMGALGQTLGKLGNSAIALGKKMYEGEQGMSAYNDAITSTTDALGDLLEKIPLVGKALAFLARSAGKYAAEVNRMSDDLYSTYQNISKAGLSAEDGMMGVAAASQKLGYGLSQVGLERFTQLLTDASRDLALMGGSAMDGRKRFVQFSGDLVRGQVGAKLQNLGLRIEDLNESAARYVANQVSLGRATAMTDQELREGTVEYIRELDLLTKLTGQNAKDIQSQIDANRRQERFRAAIEKVRREQGDEAARTLELNMAAVAQVAPETAQGLMDIAAGFVNTEAAQKVMLSGMQNVPREMTKSIGGGFNELTQAAKRTTDQMGSLGEVGAFGQAFGNLYEQYKLAGLTQTDYQKRLEQAIRTQKLQEQGADGLVGAQTDARRAQLDVRDRLQDLVKAGVIPATKAMAGFARLTGKVANMTEAEMGLQPFSEGAPGGPTGAVPRTAPGAPGAAPTGTTPGQEPGGGGLVGAAGRFLRRLSSGGIGYTGAEGVGDPTNRLLNLIGSIEGQGNYNILVGGKTLPELTSMTVKQVLDYQSQMVASGHESTAVGKYQVIRDTLGDMLKQGVVRSDDVFNAATQDRIATALMKRRGLEDYKSGYLSADQFADSLAKEWAALPTASGQSYYQGKGSNQALISRDKLMEAITSARIGGVFNGPQSGYRAVLHGSEAVVPLPNGRSIPVEIKSINNSNLMDQISTAVAAAIPARTESQQSSVSRIDNIGELSRTLSENISQGVHVALAPLLESLVDLQKTQNYTTEKLLRVSRN